jgi:hypothetical protein
MFPSLLTAMLPPLPSFFLVCHRFLYKSVVIIRMSNASARRTVEPLHGRCCIQWSRDQSLLYHSRLLSMRRFIPHMNVVILELLTLAFIRKSPKRFRTEKKKRPVFCVLSAVLMTILRGCEWRHGSVTSARESSNLL